MLYSVKRKNRKKIGAALTAVLLSCLLLAQACGNGADTQADVPETQQGVSPGTPPAQDASAGDAAAQNVSAGETAGQDVSAGNAAAQNVSAGDAAAQNASAGDAAGQNIPEHTASSEDTPGQKTSQKKNGKTDASAQDPAEPASAQAAGKNISAASGALSVSGATLTDSSGNAVQLRGISTHGLAWFPDYVNEDCFRQLRDEWNVNVIRLAMYTAEYGGYCSGGNQESLKHLIQNGVAYATSLNMCVFSETLSPHFSRFLRFPKLRFHLCFSSFFVTFPLHTSLVSLKIIPDFFSKLS